MKQNQYSLAAANKGLEFDHQVFLVLSYTSMRARELIALKWKDIDFNNYTISITKTYYNPTNNTVKYQLVAPKTRSSRRTIIVDEIIINTLMAHKEKQDRVKAHYKDQYHNEEFIFARSERKPGYPFIVKTVETRMARLLKIAGLNEDLTPHSLRHTHTSLLAEAKVGLEEIMDRLGHSDDSTTRNVYLHITTELKNEASQKFSELMRNLE